MAFVTNDSTSKILTLLPKRQAPQAAKTHQDALDEPAHKPNYGNNLENNPKIDEELKQKMKNIYINNMQDDLSIT